MVQMACLVYLARQVLKVILAIKVLQAEMEEMVKTEKEDLRVILDNLDLLVIRAAKVEME